MCFTHSGYLVTLEHFKKDRELTDLMEGWFSSGGNAMVKVLVELFYNGANKWRNGTSII